jgi:TonB family protein
VDIPRYRGKIPRALTVFYFDLGAGRIPARYDAELPLPSAEIAARLAKGDGLVAARERPGAPPVLLIAAPRDVQLVQVEEALAAMKSLPTEPVAVPVNGARQPEEIQSVVRASFGAFRQCYEAVLKVSPAATGTVKMHFVIRNDGSVEGVSAVADGPLRDAAFERCMTAAVQGLAFPAAPGGKVTVTYPIVFSP